MFADYSSPEYWNDRYSKDLSEFDFYFTFDEVKELLTENVLGDDKDIEIFVPGIGASSLPEHLHAGGFDNLTCVDSSKVLIDHVSKKYSHLTEADFLHMDVTRIPLDKYGDVYDLVIDKAFIDALLCSSTDFNAVSRAITSFYYMLKEGKKYVCISHGAPPTRLAYLSPKDVVWRSIEVVEIPKENLTGHKGANNKESYFMYICTK